MRTLRGLRCPAHPSYSGKRRRASTWCMSCWMLWLMRVGIFGLLTASLWAVPTFTVSPKAVNISHGSARLVWIASENPTSATVEWGITVSYATSRTGAKSSATPWTGSVLISGLAPSTPYYWRVTLNTGGSVATGSFTTAAEPSPHPATPATPTLVDVSMPTINGNTYNVASDCSNLQAQIDAVAALTDALNHQIVIPVGAVCYGNWVFPVKSGSGWTLVRSDAAGGSAFPPEGVRWTTNWPVASTLATFVTRTLGMGYGAQTVIPSGGASCPPTCSCANNANFAEGAFYHVTGLNLAQFPLERCDNDNPAYGGGTAITSYVGSNPITVTASNSLAEGQIIQIDAGAVAGSPAPGRYYAYDVTSSEFKVKAASAGTGGSSFSVHTRYRLPTHTNSASDPAGGCTEEQWWYNNTSGAYWWCVAGAWVRFEKPTATVSYGHVAIRVSGKKYRFIGLELKNQQVPQAGTFPLDWDVPGYSSWNEQGRVQGLAEVDAAASNVVFDRCYFAAAGKPARVNVAVRVNANDFALIESSVTGFATWRKGQPAQSDANGAVFHYQGNGLLLRNNLLETAGITYFSPNPEETGQWPVTDITVERNELRRLASWRKTGSQLDNYPQRESLELKQGHRVLVRGNYFNYCWSGITAGGFLLFSVQLPYTMPAAWALTSCTNGLCTLASSSYQMQPGDVAYITGNTSHNGIWEVASNGCPATCTQFTLTNPPTGSDTGGSAQVRVFGMALRDVTVRDNLLYQGTEFWRGGVGGNGGEYWVRPTGPLWLRNNLVVDLDVRSYAAGGRVDDNGAFPNGDFGGRLGLLVDSDFEDATIRHNTFYGSRGNAPTFLAAGATTGDVNEGFLFSDNLFKRDANVTYAPVRGGASSGKSTLDERFKRYTGNPWDSADHTANAYWTSGRNALCCGESADWSASHPAGYFWPTVEADVKWLRSQITSGYDFRLRHDSPYKSGGAQRASDDLDIGVDVDALKAAQGTVENARVRSVSATTAIVSYLAPDSAACTVEYGTSATWGTGTRVADGGGDRVRNVTLSPLSGASVYYYRLLCAVEQPSGNFKTL